MYIKLVIIQGFKSYKEQVSTEPFDPRINCVIGANGSGKSNFFHAIRFVLSDLFQSLRKEDRKSLLHEGAGHQVLSAFVEIVFDNSDNRIPVDMEEVRLRRTVTHKKDEYSLNGKHTTKTEVLNLLESAGFSCSNPYYVVQQGKIASLTLMKDSQRLDLLKEIGGTRVYEEKRRESLKVMQETGKKRTEIIQVLQYLNEKLKELDEEKEELCKFQLLDKQRKSLEYVIFDKEIDDARKRLVEVEEECKKVSEKSAKMETSMLYAKKKSKELDKAFEKTTREMQSLSKEKEEVEKQRTEAIKKHAQVELDDRDLQEKISENMRAKEDAVKQLDILQREIQDSTEELNEIKPIFSTQVREEEEIERGIQEREKKLNFLYQKQGRASQFASKVDRNKWLQKEIGEYNQVLKSNLMQEKIIKEEIEELNLALQEHDTRIDGLETEFATLEFVLSQYPEGYSQYKSLNDKLLEEKKSSSREASKLGGEIDELKEEIKKVQTRLESVTPWDLRRGLNFVRRFCKETQLGGVFGPLIELLDCDEKLFPAVEVSAGNSLFNVVVENDEISYHIIRHLNRCKGGRVTFIPLNKVWEPYVTYPESHDVAPLLKKLHFLPKFNSAFALVFARTLVCRDQDVAARVTRTDDLECITLEGDQMSNDGVMTGGFFDYNRSRLRFMNMIKVKSNEMLTKENDRDKVQSRLEEIDQKITELQAEQFKNDAKCSHDKSELEQLKHDIRSAYKQKQSISNALVTKEKLLENVLGQIAQLNAKISMKHDEMGTEIVENLSVEEQNLLIRLSPEITELKEKLVPCKANRIDTEIRKTELENNLSTNLVRRKEELEAVKSSGEIDMLLTHAQAKRQELDDAEALLDDLNQQLKNVSESVDDRTRELKKIKDEKNKLQTMEENYERTLDDENKESEELASKRNMLLTKQEELSKKIRELGPLSSDAFETYKRKCLKELYKVLQKCKEHLQQFSHVNQKALNQYVNFTEQREEFQKRKAELDTSDEKIKELITGLDQQKDESIERTFKAVAKHFREVFSELVEGGQGFLVMVKKKDGDLGDGDGDGDEDEDSPPANREGRVQKYIGVKVKVSFGQGDRQSMKQLSGGQKTVVALTLIFAIQRCDPAPFYLFDEIDAALDSQYRTAIGIMIRRLANMSDTQFITTTFHPELVTVSDRIYGVIHKNRVSYVNVVAKEDALDFIEQDQSHNS